jgi:hypothetical protein
MVLVTVGFIKKVCVRQLLSQYPVLEQLIVNRKFYQALFCNYSLDGANDQVAFLFFF